MDLNLYVLSYTQSMPLTKVAFKYQKGSIRQRKLVTLRWNFYKKGIETLLYSDFI